MNKGFFLLVLIACELISLFPSIAQEKISVSGIVTDAHTKEPIRGANVFFNHTSLAAVTDSLGVYRIDNVPAGLKELVAASVGYVTQLTILHSPDKRPLVFFKMTPDNPPDPVITSAARRTPVLDEKKWNDLYARFKNVLLGSSVKTEILNPSVIHFELSDTQLDLFFAHSDQPLIITNQSLGYKLYISMVEFRASTTTHNMIFRSHFDTLTARSAIERMRWRMNRLAIYRGSPRHLFNAARKGRLQEEGFRVYHGLVTLDVTSNRTLNWPAYHYLMSDEIAAPSAIYVDTTNLKFKIFGRGFYQIDYINSRIPKKERIFKDYPFPLSWLDVRDSSINLTSHGEPVLPSEFTFSGYMNRYRISEMLPHDYNPDQEKSDFVISGQIKSLSLRGSIKDENGKPVSEVDVFVHHGLNHTTTDDQGRFELHNLRPGLYPVGFAHPEMEKAIRTIPVSADDHHEISVQLRTRIPLSYNISASNQNRDSHWQTLMRLFESKLCRQLGYNSTIVNSYVLLFRTSEKRIDVQAVAPVVIEDRRFGYRWTYFMDSAALMKEDESYELHSTGLVKIDTLPAKSAKENYRWQSNRFNEYTGSWNHFLLALMEGKTEAEGFKLFGLTKPPPDKPAKWKKLTKDDYVTLPPDSILRTEEAKFYLQIPAGFEIHFENRKDSKKMYSDYPYRVMRIIKGCYVPITVDGIVAPGGFEILETQMEFLPRVPVDFYPENWGAAELGVKPLIKK